MDVLEYDRFGAFAERHASDWRRLADSCEAATVFQTWEWLSAWAACRPPRGFLGLAFVEGGVPVGAAALEVSGRTVRHLGTGVSDFLDLLAAPGREAAVAAALAQCLRSRRGWDWADFQQARADSVSAQMPGATLWIGETCPYLPLPDDWETFRRGLSKSLRSNIGYYERALAKRHKLELRLANAATLEADMEAFFALHQQRWSARWMPGAFAEASARTFHLTAARALLATDRLRLHTLLLDDIPRASLYCFQKGRRCYYYLGGFDPELARFSPGTVLTARAIRHAIEADRATEFDFLRGNESYKYRWGAQDRHNRRVTFVRPGGVGALRRGLGALQLRAELRLKSWMHARHGGAGPTPSGKE